jgi:two-component system, chemotaxis family, chemotaxis protein CheY
VGSKAVDIGAVGHLAKPFELNDLLDMVRRALEPASKVLSSNLPRA